MSTGGGAMPAGAGGGVVSAGAGGGVSLAQGCEEFPGLVGPLRRAGSFEMAGGLQQVLAGGRDVACRVIRTPQ